MDDADLHADCTKCAALCCVALAFDKSPQFRNDKAAGKACQNLSRDGTCTIHDDLEGSGFKGCMAYDCLGAGQHVTQKLFEGQTWQNDPLILKPMMEAFWAMHRVHEQILVLREADKLALPPGKRQELLHYAAMLQPEQGWTKISLAEFINGPTLKDIRLFLATLSEFVMLEREG